MIVYTNGLIGSEKDEFHPNRHLTTRSKVGSKENEFNPGRKLTTHSKVDVGGVAGGAGKPSKCGLGRARVVPEPTEPASPEPGPCWGRQR